METLQGLIYNWTVAMFGSARATSKKERALRFIEEEVELVQALGLNHEEVAAVVNRNYQADVGNVAKELAQTQFTLYPLAESIGEDAEELCRSEFNRVRQYPKEYWEGLMQELAHENPRRF